MVTFLPDCSKEDYRQSVKMPAIFASCALAALLLSVACADHHHHEGELSRHKLSPPNADFAFALYKTLNAKAAAEENIFYSPLGIATALTVLSTGARGETHSQLFSTLGYSTLNQTQINEAYEDLFHMLGHSQVNEQLNLGNAVALRSGFIPLEKFLKDVRHYYHGEVFNIDLTNPDEAAAEINTYIANKTEHKITDAVKDLDPALAMMLINYVYFKGEWATPFMTSLTHKADFHVDNTTIVQVDTMSNNYVYVNFYYDAENHTTVIKLPYKGNTSMMIVLPDEGKLKDVESYISKDYIRHWNRKLKMKCLNLSMPKFSISTEYSLKDTLCEMGITDAFADNADFSGISDAVELKVSKVYHQAVLNVDEFGTEAAAITTVQIAVKSLCLSETIKINRPFLVFILEKPTRSILFMAKINNPTAQ